MPRSALRPALLGLLLTPCALAADGLVPGQVLVQVRPGALPALEARVALTAPGAVHRPALPFLSADRADPAGLRDILVLDVPEGAEQALADDLAAQPFVLFATPNHTAGGVTGAIVPNDPMFGAQWALQQGSDIDMDVPEAWDLRGSTTAANLIVAVVDTGYDIAVPHPDWNGVVWTNPGEVQNGLDDDGNGLVDDLHGYDFAYDDNQPNAGNPHGVETGGIIGANTGNGNQVAGIASGVTLMPLKAFTDGGFFPSSGPYAGELSAAAAISYAVEKGARIISNSWTNGTSPSAVINASIDDAIAHGVHLVFAAGNAGSTQGWPAQHADVTAVAAIDSAGHRSIWGFQSSNYGPWVDVAAAGTGVTTTTTNAGTVTDFAGTSAACPQVAGVAALLLSQDDDLTPFELRQVLVQGAVNIDALNPGYIGLLGSGHCNAFGSLELLDGFVDRGQRLSGDHAFTLNGWGSPDLDGGPLTLSLTGGAPLQPGLLVLGLSELSAPFKGGVLVPNADVVVPVSTDSRGSILLATTVPAAFPSSPSLWVQYAFVDGGAPLGVALSNALEISGT